MGYDFAKAVSQETISPSVPAALLSDEVHVLWDGVNVEGGLGVELVAGFPDLFVVVELVVDDVVDVEEVVHHLALVGVRTLGAQQALVGPVPVVELDDMPHLKIFFLERTLVWSISNLGKYDGKPI